MENGDIHEVVRILQRVVQQWKTPVVTRVSGSPRDPFRILISCILSLRTKDETTESAARRLFELADSPGAMLKLSSEKIEKAIYPVGFYRNKACAILEISHQLVKNYHSQVPHEIDELLKLKGVGRKTANLVVTLGYKRAGICVDTHVHRISNRWGYVKTSTPQKTERALRKKLPPEYWVQFNDLLVTLGQNLCRPLSPRCSLCLVRNFCSRVSVARSR